LYIAGAGVARGYLKRPELTAEKFVPNPFGRGDRLYRTGDLARWLSSGEIEFLGRIDNQVKIRGIRVELEEIESVLAQHPFVKDAVVMVRPGVPSGYRRLEGFVVPKEKQTIPLADLRRYLKTRLPEYMIPATISHIDRLPMSSNGKVDRQSLAGLETGEAMLDEEFVAPHTPLQEVMAGIWAEVLNLSRVGIDDNFFELGGHSLLATQVMSRIRGSFRLELPVRSIFEAPTVAELAEVILRDPDSREAIEKRAAVLLRVVKLSDTEVDVLLSERSEASPVAEKGSSRSSVTL
jgi:acyl carrier protein